MIEIFNQNLNRRMDSNLEKLAAFWVQHVSPKIALLSVTVGIAGLTGCAFCLWVVDSLLIRTIPNLYPTEVEMLQWIHQFANPFLDMLMLLVTKLSNPEIAVPIGLVTLVTLLIQQAHLEAWIVTIAGLGAIFLNKGLKPMFARLRPDLYPQLIQENSFSFPSGHALGTVVLYGAIAYLLAKHYPHYRIWIYLLAAILVMAVGLSRLYLGVHWPTDVLAGWAIGLLWLITCIVMLQLQKLQTLKQTKEST
ncbi:phosphatase PAP2 family protein [Tumidithrix elongata RA019]|uniref:Phosphatase PAP2 family protein n=1 Tax=Tumidithrix elongata BACA0141 TaxID=2716417 RepID=A0AAW9Q7S7_9CYAN|nr:phosphatase PAP2 family protein [Tumidithrix elongata RA019]